VITRRGKAIAQRVPRLAVRDLLPHQASSGVETMRARRRSFWSRPPSSIPLPGSRCARRS
jgi:hypothetical protein